MSKRIPPDAFDFYFALGPERSYERVAEKYGVSKRSVTSRAKRENWQRRMVELESKARDASDKKKVESIEDRNERHLTALRFIQARAIEALKKMPIEAAMDAVRAYNMSLRDERVILGDPTDRTAVSIEDTIKREYERWMISSAPEHEDGREATEDVATDGDDEDAE